jgi:hypothetical protein
MKRILIIGTVLLAGAAACGKSPEQKAAEQTAAAAQQMAEGAKKMAEAAANTANGTAAQGMAQMMQGLSQMGQAANNGQPVQVVDYEKLKELVPELSGWERSKVKGEQQSMGAFSVSKAEADYKKGDASIDFDITDTTSVSMLLAPFMMVGANFSERSDEGYKKGINLNGMTGFEEWRKDGGHGEVHLLVANRYIVSANGRGLDSPDVARQLVQAVNLQKLAALK